MNIDKFLLRNKWYLLNLGLQIILLLSNPFRNIDHGIWPLQGLVQMEEVILNNGEEPRLLLDELLNPPKTNAENSFVQGAQEIWRFPREKRIMRSEILLVLGRIQNKINLGYSKASIEEFMRGESAIPFNINSRVLNRNTTNSSYSGVLRKLSTDYESGVTLDDKLKSWPIKKDASLIMEYYHFREVWEELVGSFYEVQLLSSDFQKNSEYLMSLVPQRVRRFDSISLNTYGYLEFFIYGFFIPFIVYLGRNRIKKP